MWKSSVVDWWWGSNPSWCGRRWARCRRDYCAWTLGDGQRGSLVISQFDSKSNDE